MRKAYVLSRVGLSAAMTLCGAAPLCAGDRELGEYLSSECVTCHQISGRYDGIPPIVGWPETDFVQALGEYRNKSRENAVMRSIAVKFSDEEIAALASYFGSIGPHVEKSQR